jgi:alanine dehydrogenase
VTPRPADLTVGFPLETAPERRTLLSPDLARDLVAAGFDVIAERGIGAGIYTDDEALAATGVSFADQEDAVWAAPLVLRYKSPDPADLSRLTPGQSIAALFHAEGDVDLLTALKKARVTAWSYEFLSEEAGFPLGRPGGQIAGIQAVLAAAQALQHPQGRGVLLAAVPGAPPANVVVIGSGNVGAAAARTATALGAHVTVLAHTESSQKTYLAEAPTGVRVLVNDPATLRAAIADADVVIGAILISTFDTPAMLEEKDLAMMRPGAVIVDATCGYGPGYLPTAGPVQKPGDPPRVVSGILHVKVDVLPALAPVTTSAAYCANAAPYLVRLAQAAVLGAADPAVDSALIAADGKLVHPVLRQHARIYGLRP